ncbi:MAG: plastocyanin/azurin family copper-binding protein [Steroidobacteraceae bacterium]
MMKRRALNLAVSAQCASRRTALLAALVIPFGYCVETLPAAPKKRVQLNIASDGDLLAFKPDHLSCAPGAAVHLTFSHTGKYITQDHNWVLTVPGAAEAVAQAAMAAGENSRWTPRGDKRILAATPPCGKGQHVSVDFVAPAPGDYPFLCTTPGHGAVMHGVLHVTPKLNSSMSGR